MIRIKIEYPCGYKIEEEFSTFAAWLGKLEFDSRWGCPLHNKDCNKYKWIKKK